MKSQSKPAAIVLLSGGLDSTVNLYAAAREFNVVGALTFSYGQKAVMAEIRAARWHTNNLKIAHHIVELPFFSQFTKTALIKKDQDIPSGKNVSIDDLKTSRKTAEAVWVPNRNGIFLNIAAGYAEGLGADYVVPGFNLEEAKTFEDNSKEFMKALTNSFKLSTRTQVEVFCFTDKLNKTEIVKLARELNINLENIWSCYLPGPKKCGQCESCQRFNRAVNA